jgi:hypothetical protein
VAFLVPVAELSITVCSFHSSISSHNLHHNFTGQF